MSTNIANLMVGLGYDLSALQKGAPEAFRMINEQTLGMSAQMKRNAREGAEAFRSIDEMIGIHINRPMTRLLVETFPQFGKALSDIIGGVAFGAVAFAGYEVFERISKGFEQGAQAQKEFRADVAKTVEVWSDAMQSFEKAEKLRSLSGLGKKLFEVDFSSIEEARKQIDELAASYQKMLKDEAAQSGWKASLYELGHRLTTAPTELRAEDLAKQFEPLGRTFDTLSKLDALKGTHDSAKFITDELAKANKSLTEMSAQRMTGTEEFITNHLPGLAKMVAPETGKLGVSDAEIAKETQFRDLLLQISTLLQAAAKNAQGSEDVARQTEAFADLQRRIELQDAYNKEVLRLSGPEYEQAHLQLLQSETAELQKHLTLLPEQAEEVKRLQAEMQKVRITIVGQEQIEALGIVQDELKAVNTHADEFWKKWDQVNNALENTAVVGAAFRTAFGDFPLSAMDEADEAAKRLDMSLTDSSARLKEFTRINGTIGGVLPPVVSPQPSDITALQRLHTTALGAPVGVSEEQNELWQKAQQTIDSIETPLQKYNAGMEMLDELSQAGYLDTEQFAAAQTKLKEALAESSNKMEELLRKTGDYSAGVQAFFMQLEKEGQGNAAFTFQFMTEALHGFNDEVAKGITTGKANWKEYFRSLDEMAIKFFLTKSENAAFQGIADTGIGKSIGGLLGLTPKIDMTGVSSGPSPSQTPLPPGVFGIPNDAFAAAGKALPAIGATGQDAAVSANTAGLTANTSALTALTARLGVSSLGVGGGFGGFGASGGAEDLGSADSLFPEIPGFATGTDSAPGGFAWVGEQGPELLNLPAGSSVTPSGSARGGDTHVYQDFRGAVVSEELMRKADFQRAMSAARPGIIGEAVANAMEIQRRTPRR